MKQLIIALIAMTAIHSNAQEAWFVPVNIGQHTDTNNVEPVEVYEHADSIFQQSTSKLTPAIEQEVEAMRDKWMAQHHDTYKERFNEMPAFALDPVNAIEVEVAAFSNVRVTIDVKFTYGHSRWHHYAILLKRFEVWRNELVDELFQLEALWEQYSYFIEEVWHGVSAEKMMEQLGKDFVEYPGQSLQFRQVYYANHDVEITLQNNKVKYLTPGKPEWVKLMRN